MHDLLPTAVIGSYPQPPWLVDRDMLVAKGVPRVRASDVWRIDPEHLLEAQQAASLMAIRDQELAGVDIVTDGEIGRESYFNHFATSLGGVDPVQIGEGVNRLGGKSLVPLVNGPIRRDHPIEVDSARFLRANTDRLTKVTIPGAVHVEPAGPETDHYSDQRELSLAYARAINEELADLEALGIDVLQLDEPYLQANAEAASGFAVEAVATAVEGITTTTVLHTCYGYAVYVKDKTGGYPFLAELGETPVDQIAVEAAQPQLDPSTFAPLVDAGKTIVLGVVDLGDREPETPAVVAERIRNALGTIPADKLVVAPDCGMKFLRRDEAIAKLEALVEGAALVRSETER